MKIKINLFILGLVISLLGLLDFDKSVSAEEFGCPANPGIGARCTKRVSIRLRKLQSADRDEFDRRFEPGAGWAIQDCDVRGGERGRTGEVSGPSCIEVQAGSTTTSSSYVQSQSSRVSEMITKARAEGNYKFIQAYAEIENKSRSEFSDLQRSASEHQSRNYGLQIKAWVAVEGGCRNRFLGDCVNWGPGGSLDTDVIVNLVYVGTNQDINRVAEGYIAKINEIQEQERIAKNNEIEEAKRFQEQLARENGCVSVNSNVGWQSITTKVGGGQFLVSRSNKWSTTNSDSNAKTDFEGNDVNGNRFSNDHKYGALIMRLPSGRIIDFYLMRNGDGSTTGTINSEQTEELRTPAGTTLYFRINEADESLSDNEGSIEVCHGGGVG